MRSYIVPRLVNVFKTYNVMTGQEKVEKFYYPINRCTPEYYNSEYLKDYYKN